MMGAVFQMEREIKAERAEVGRAAAKTRGKTGGLLPGTDANSLPNSDKSAAQVCQLFEFSRRMLFKGSEIEPFGTCRDDFDLN
jgi:DNA invertase Pin-like site-specific DNA recombinase